MKLKDIEFTVRSFRVPSKSHTGVYYTVELSNKGNLWCDCQAGQYRRLCSHSIKVREFLQKYEPEIYKTLKEPKSAQKSKK